MEYRYKIQVVLRTYFARIETGGLYFWVSVDLLMLEVGAGGGELVIVALWGCCARVSFGNFSFSARGPIAWEKSNQAFRAHRLEYRRHKSQSQSDYCIALGPPPQQSSSREGKYRAGRRVFIADFPSTKPRGKRSDRLLPKENAHGRSRAQRPTESEDADRSLKQSPPRFSLSIYHESEFVEGVIEIKRKPKEKGNGVRRR